MEKHRWCTRFYRADGQPTESYYFWDEAEARTHFDMFRDFDDDDGMYKRIELLELPDERSMMGVIKEALAFPHCSVNDNRPVESC